LKQAGAPTNVGPLLLEGWRPTLGFGAWGVGGSGWGSEGTEAERRAAIEVALTGGITFFDTAPTYGDGESERLLGRVVQPVRDRTILATKVGPRDDARRSLEGSLRRLGTDYVDLVQLHETVPGWERQLDTLQALREEGKARAVGMCNATARELRRALEVGPLVSYQAPHNLFDRDVESGVLPFLASRGVAFLAYRPLASGLLTGKYEARPHFAPQDHRAGIYWFKEREFDRRQSVLARLRQLAADRGISLAGLSLRWLLSRPGVTVVLAGARNAAQVEENLTALAGPLDASTVASIDEIVREAFRLPQATPAAAAEATLWGPRERFIVERLDGTRSAEAIAAEWSDRGEMPMVAAQVKVFADQLSERGLAVGQP
jgi:aryl-alcohol dehydrogenase-like predicted oxidoreductase